MRRSRKAINQMNVVPYIDVMLVLLVIFMVTAPLVTPGEIELPSVGSATITPKQPLEITITKDKGLKLYNRAKPNDGMQSFESTETLINRVRALQQDNIDQPVVIAADKTVPYGAVVNVLDLMQRNQVKKVGLQVVPGSADKK